MIRIIRTVFMLLLLCLMCGCGSEEYVSVQDRLVNMQSYETKAKITYISDKGSTVLDTKQYASADGRYRIDILSPEEAAGCSLIYDGKMVWHINPRLEQNKVSFTPTDKNERRQLILFSFIENMNKRQDSDVKTAAPLAGDFTALEASISDEYKLLCSEKLWIDNSSGSPMRLAVYDTDGKERIIEEFSEFEYNKAIDDSCFEYNGR